MGLRAVCAWLGIVTVMTPGAVLAGHASRPALTFDSISANTFSPLPDPPDRVPRPQIVRAAILLDRARFSPGAIDGIDGDNFRKALTAYQQQQNLGASGHLDRATWDKLGVDAAPVLIRRKVTAAEAKGPFVRRIPAKMEAQASLERLSYTNLTEELAEELHESPGLLRALNPGVRFAEGSEVIVPQVVVERGAPAKVARIMVDKAGHAVNAYGSDGKLLAYYPASIGSEEKPAPSGQFTVVHVTHNPDYTYNPRYAFKGVRATKPFRIAPGPNNPVGSVWIDLSDEGYGIHGTPEPDLVGKTQSHGCIRLTNWDVEDLASMVGKGVVVDFLQAATDQAGQPGATAHAAPVSPPKAP